MVLPLLGSRSTCRRPRAHGLLSVPHTPRTCFLASLLHTEPSMSWQRASDFLSCPAAFHTDLHRAISTAVANTRKWISANLTNNKTTHSFQQWKTMDMFPSPQLSLGSTYIRRWDSFDERWSHPSPYKLYHIVCHLVECCVNAAVSVSSSIIIRNL